MSQTITGAALIGYQDLPPEADTFDAYNPSTGEPLSPSFRISGAEDVERACALADTAFEPYRQLPYSQRAAFLNAISAEIMALGDDLIDRAVAETGLPEARIRTERARTCGQLELFARVVERGD